MKLQHQILYGVVIALAAALGAFVAPAAAWVLVAALFATGATAVFAVRALVLQHVEGSARTCHDMAMTLIQSLLHPDTDGASPSFLSNARGDRRLRNLYRNPLFNALCGAIRTLGPVPCYPPYLYLQRAA